MTLDKLRQFSNIILPPVQSAPSRLKANKAEQAEQKVS